MSIKLVKGTGDSFFALFRIPFITLKLPGQVGLNISDMATLSEACTMLVNAGELPESAAPKFLAVGENNRLAANSSSIRDKIAAEPLSRKAFMTWIDLDCPIQACGNPFPHTLLFKRVGDNKVYLPVFAIDFFFQHSKSLIESGIMSRTDIIYALRRLKEIGIPINLEEIYARLEPLPPEKRAGFEAYLNLIRKSSTALINS